MSRSRVVLATYTYSWARIETRGPLATYHGRQPEQHCLDNVQCNNTTTPWAFTSTYREFTFRKLSHDPRKLTKFTTLYLSDYVVTCKVFNLNGMLRVIGV